MNWKRRGWVRDCFLFALLVGAVMFGTRGDIKGPTTFFGPPIAQADTFQLATSSFTVFNVLVSSFNWTQVDNPQMVGRTAIEIFNLDSSSGIVCRQDNLIAVNGASSLFNQSVSSNIAANTIAGRLIPPSVYTSSLTAGGQVIAGQQPYYEGKWSLSLSNFASNRGAYPVSVSMPVFCITARVVPSTVTVTQSN